MMTEPKREHRINNRCFMKHYYTNDATGFIDGEYKEWYKEWYYDTSLRFLKKQCFYLNGSLHGEYKEWDYNGVLLKQCFYKNSLLDGEYKEWETVNFLKKHCFYRDGVLHGEMNLAQQHWIGGYKHRRLHYENGKVQGTCKEWIVGNVDPAVLLLECDIKDDQVHGKLKIYNQGGTLVKHCFILNGMNYHGEYNGRDINNNWSHCLYEYGIIITGI